MLLEIIAVSMITTHFGVYLSHRLSKKILSRVFSVLILVLVIKLYWEIF